MLGSGWTSRENSVQAGRAACAKSQGCELACRLLISSVCEDIDGKWNVQRDGERSGSLGFVLQVTERKGAR
jgi:hypothetical protein